MFETVQIARRHLLRFEYPELVDPLETDDAPARSVGIAGALAAWFGGSVPEGGEPEKPDEGDNESLVSYWPLFPYY